MNLIAFLGTAIMGIAFSPQQPTLQASATSAQPPAQAVVLETTVDIGTGSLGEPIVLNYRLVNRSNETISVDWKGEQVVIGDVKRQAIPPWLSLRFEDDQGKALPNRFYDRPIYRAEHAYSVPPRSLRPGGAREYAVVLSQWYHPRFPGIYTLHLRPDISFEAASGSKGTIDDARTITISVGITSYRKLQARAEALSSQIVEGKDFFKSYSSVLALFSMPDTVANVWRSLLQNRKFQFRDWARNVLQFRDSPIALALAAEFAPRYIPGARIEVESKGNGTP